MDREQILRDLMNLPPQAQQMVVDFIAFLRTRYAKDSSSEEKTPPLPAMQDEPFIGMWHDRTDMTDSSAWVRAARKREWS